MQSLPTLHRMTSTMLSSLLLSPTASATLAIIDVRDSDHVGGHIRSSIHAPSSSLDYRLPELVRTLRGKETVVFHCALSQQRGPGAAMRYLGERDRMVKRKEEEGGGGGKREGKMGVAEERLGKGDAKEAVGEEGEVGKVDGTEEEVEREREREQKVWVLDGGFMKWQERYGTDERLTEDYAPDIWSDY